MTPDLERRIRTALRERAADVTPRRTERSAEAARAGSRWLPPLLAAVAVVVVAVAVALAVTVHRGSGSDKGGTAAGGPAYAGYQWRVTSLQDRHGLLQVPPDIEAIVGYTPDGSVYADDTVNHLTATYVPGTSAYTVEHAGTTFAVYGGGDRTRVRVIAAVNALFFTVSGAVPDDGPGDSPQGTIEATVQGDTLTLRTAGIDIITVTLERQGPVPAAPSEAPSSTRIPSTAPSPVSDVPGSASASDDPYFSGPVSP